MKKLLLAIAVLFILGICAVYLLIPKDLVVSHSVIINTSDKNVFEFLKDKQKLAKWWPEKQPSSKNIADHDSSFHYGHQTFVLDGLLYNSIALNIEQDGVGEKSKIVVVPIAPDTARVAWECKLDAGLNPITRVKQYFIATDIKKDMAAILGGLKSYLDKSEHIYGYPIAYERLKDTLYLSHTLVAPAYPDTKLIISVLEKLHNYTKLAGAIESGYPIMTISHLQIGKYQTVIALPINNLVPETKDFILKRMPYQGRVLSTQVVGDMPEVLKGLEAIKKYQSDFWLEQPIVPYFSLITDRAKEPDSTKWVTKIWGPIY